MTAPTPEKAAPIPADVLERFFETLAPTPTEREKTIAALAAGYVAAALLAARASREERIREDAIDRLFAMAPDAPSFNISLWLREQGAMLPDDRARQRGDAS